MGFFLSERCHQKPYESNFIKFKFQSFRKATRSSLNENNMKQVMEASAKKYYPFEKCQKRFMFKICTSQKNPAWENYISYITHTDFQA